MRRGLTLVEVLVVLALAAVLLGLLLPALAGAREAGRAAVCLANLRQAVLCCHLYAGENRGQGPAIGQPYASWPNWALVVQTYAGQAGSSSADLYATRSVLVCPSAAAVLGVQMQRTSAMNATGHAGLPAMNGYPPDPDDYDDPQRPAFIRLDRIEAPAHVPLILDSSSPAPATSNPPPPTRTAGAIDFRQEAHVAWRVGRYHGRPGRLSVGACDGAARTWLAVMPEWERPLP